MKAHPELLPVFNHSERAGAVYLDRVGFGRVAIQPELRRFVVSRVRIELTTRGFSIQDTNRSRFGINPAERARRAGSNPENFNRLLTTVAQRVRFSGFVTKTRPPAGYVARKRGGQ